MVHRIAKKTVQFKDESELCNVYFYSFQCDECDFVTAKQKNLDYHLKSHAKKNQNKWRKFWSLIFSATYLIIVYLCLGAAEKYFQEEGGNNCTRNVKMK